MARKKVVKADPMVRIRVHRSFNGMYKDDEATVPYDRVVKGWERAHLVKVLEYVHGTGTTR